MPQLVSFLLFAIITVSVSAQARKPMIAFASDTQQPMWIEKLRLKSNHNEKATEAIFKDADKAHPIGFFILGDVVSLGYKNNKWTAIDRYIKQCTRDSIPVYATLGNHEVMFNKKRGTKNFSSRFPMYKSAGYAEIADSVAVILLNSNFSKMTNAEIIAQDNWYNAMVRTLDSSRAIRLIIVGCHHSPYTNSRIVKPSITVRDHFLPAFINSKKCVLFVSGHSHNFERFDLYGKSFLVIGGGGGLHQPLYAKEITHDLAASYKPAFHYLEVVRSGDSLQVVSRELNTAFSGFTDGLTFNIQRQSENKGQ